jgi:hypothetical protein
MNPMTRGFGLRTAIIIALAGIASLALGAYTAKACGPGLNNGYFLSRSCFLGQGDCSDSSKRCMQDMCYDQSDYQFCYSCQEFGECSAQCYQYSTCCSSGC